jgi:hypothetical protein
MRSVNDVLAQNPATMSWHRTTFTVEEESPSPGGEANGLWNGCPVIPATKCGTAFVRNAPPKK